MLKPHFQGDDSNLTATLLELIAELSKSGVFFTPFMHNNHANYVASTNWDADGIIFYFLQKMLEKYVWMKDMFHLY